MLTSQNNSRTATAPIAADILGEVRWYDESSGKSGECSINKPQCSIGSNPSCTIALPFQNVADIHATLVFGRRFILLKAPYPTHISGRQVREFLIDRFTELTIGSVHIEVIPSHEIGKKPKRPRVIRSQELVEHASLMSLGDLSPIPIAQSQIAPTQNTSAPQFVSNPAALSAAPATEQADIGEERLVAIETTLGKLQSAVEIIQSQSHETVPSTPVDLSQQIAAMGKSVADELEQRLAYRLDSQALSQTTLVNQIRDEALRPIESTLGGLLGKLDDLSSQQIETSNRLDALASSTESQLLEWNQWRESILQPTEIDQADYHAAYHQPYQPSNNLGIETVDSLDPELQAPLATNYNSEYFSQELSNHEFVDDQGMFPGYQSNALTDYSQEQAYGQSGFDSQPVFDSQYSAQNAEQNAAQNIYESESAVDPSLPMSESSYWNETPADQQSAGTNSTVEEYRYDSSATYERDEIPILTTLENQILAYDVPPQENESLDIEYLRSTLSSYLETGDDHASGSAENENDYLANSPLAAFLRPSTTSSPSQADGETQGEYSANLESFLANDQPRDEPAKSSPILRANPYASPTASPVESTESVVPQFSVDDETEQEELPKPTSELSLRLRQMLAELKAEDNQSTYDNELDSYQPQEPKVTSHESQPIDDVNSLAQPSWLREYAASSAHDDEDQTMELSNDIGGLDHRHHASSDPLDLENDIGRDLEKISSNLPSFDWSKGSLLASDNAVEEEPEQMVSPEHVEEIEEEVAEENQLDYSPSPASQNRQTDARTETGGGDREESIEEYMQKLLKRVKQGPAEGGESPIEEMTIKSAPRSRREFLNRSTKPSDLVASDQETVNSGDSIVAPVKRPAPTQVDMGALRELANSNARRAIARSETKRANTTILIKVAITSFAIASAALILLLNGFKMNPPFAGFVAALVVAYLWGSDCYKHFKALNNSKPQKTVTSDPEIAENTPVRTADDTEGGWRPTPI
ncbi:MAG: hypothetical protein MUC43_11385 [Pirellula sp.]|jgi:hypothetical protein|nr:hypothetical protein [Pirellula sp.]